MQSETCARGHVQQSRFVKCTFSLFVTLKKPTEEAPNSTALAPTFLVSPTKVGLAMAF